MCLYGFLLLLFLMIMCTELPSALFVYISLLAQEAGRQRSHCEFHFFSLSWNLTEKLHICLEDKYFPLLT